MALEAKVPGPVLYVGGLLAATASIGVPIYLGGKALNPDNSSGLNPDLSEGLAWGAVLVFVIMLISAWAGQGQADPSRRQLHPDAY